jgi:hypothetical protein
VWEGFLGTFILTTPRRPYKKGYLPNIVVNYRINDFTFGPPFLPPNNLASQKYRHLKAFNSH